MIKLSPADLRQIIEEEVKKFGKGKTAEQAAKETEEVDADELATALVNKIDYVKALKLREARLLKKLEEIRALRKKLTE
jgi:hypothetical protein